MVRLAKRRRIACALAALSRAGRLAVWPFPSYLVVKYMYMNIIYTNYYHGNTTFGSKKRYRRSQIGNENYQLPGNVFW